MILFSIQQILPHIFILLHHFDIMRFEFIWVFFDFRHLLKNDCRTTLQQFISLWKKVAMIAIIQIEVKAPHFPSNLANVIE